MSKKVIKTAINNDEHIIKKDKLSVEDVKDLNVLKTSEMIVMPPNEDALITDKGFVIVGNVDAGKSTLIGTLTSGILDDGRGSARKSVARHQHEIDTGQTSDISTKILRFANGKTATLIDLCGHEKYFTTTASGISGMWPDYAIVVVSPSRGVLPMTKQHFKMLMSYNIPVIFVVTRVDMAMEESCKIVDKNIKDLCKTYKRTVEFMNSYWKYHSYVLGMNLCKKHDISKNLNEETIKSLNLKENEVIDVEEYINFETSKMTCISEINQGLKMASGKQTYIPVIYVSNVNGYYLDVIKQAMMTIEPRDLWNKDENANSIVKFFRNKLNLPSLGLENNHIGSTFYIDRAYTVKGIGLVITGINRGDNINVNEDLYLGPIANHFIKIKLRSMHNDNREDIQYLANHHRGCIAIKPLRDMIKKNQICKGMVLISSPEMIKNVCYRFEAAITIFGGHSATLRTGYSPIVHAGTIRQAAKLILPEDPVTDDNKEEVLKLNKRERKDRAIKKMKSGDIEKVTFKFRMRPEYLDPGTVFVFRSGEIHGVGCVINVLSLELDEEAQPEPVKRKFRKIRASEQVNEKDKKSVKVIIK